MTQSIRRSAGRPKAARNMADEIMNLVDEHLAWQVDAEEQELQRRGSVGTLVVDWDGEGEGRAFHRGSKRETDIISNVHHSPSFSSSPSSSWRSTPSATTATTHSHPVPYQDSQSPTRASKARARDSSVSTQTHHHIQRKPLPSRHRRSSTTVNFHSHSNTDDLSISYSPTTYTAIGFDPSTSLAYNYNGRNLLVHGTVSLVEEAFYVPVERYLASKGKELPALPSYARSEGSARKTGKVLGVVKKVMGKLERVGVLGKMKGVRERERKREY